MKNLKPLSAPLLLPALFALVCSTAKALTLTNPIVFVTQPPIPHEINGSISNSFLSVVTIFGNQRADTEHAARGGDLWLMTTNQFLVNLTRKGGFGTNGIQHGIGIDVRDPQIHWSGKKILFSMVVGSPTNSADTNQFYWQLYEVTNLDVVIANPSTAMPAIVKVPNQPTNCNNVTPCYATDGRIIFMSDRSYNNQPWLYTALDEYKGQPTVSGIYSMDPATNDVKMIEHTPSGAFNPFIDSFGRLIVTRWDHLSQDPIAADDRLGITNLGSGSLNGSFNYLSETPGALTQSTNIIETFPEPRKFDTNYDQALGVNGNDFNLFLPWALDQNGGNEEVLNHVGRHELIVPTSSTPLFQSFTGDTNLFSISNLVQRTASGVVSANTNSMASLFQITEDPRTNGLYWGVQAVDISPFGGTHASGQIVTLTGAPGVNPTNMAVTYITPPGAASGPSSLGMYRNPLPMSDGTLIAVFTDAANGVTAGSDTNIGTVTLPVSRYHFRLMTLTNSGTVFGTNQFVTGGIQSTSIFWQGNILVTNIATQWELQPIEVRAKSIPTPFAGGVAPVEQQVFAEEGIDLPTFQADLAQRGVALVVSRNVTARDAADKQQPYNLQVPGGVSSIANSGKVYDITHLQFLQADYLRGYTNGINGPMPGRRILAVPMHATTNINYASSKTNAPAGGTEIMSDGSQATFIPANRAVTWQFTGGTNESVVKERYWVSFRPGEVRTCANCHGINAVDQMGRPSPTNAPFALRQLLRLWKTNSANAYTLSVTNGNSGGSYGAGSIITLAANPAPTGKAFVTWMGSAGVSNAAAMTTSFIMPATNAALTAVYTNLPAPVFTNYSMIGGTNISLSAQAYANQSWILQSSTDLLNWVNISTNSSASNQLYQVGVPVNGTTRQFFRLISP
jgi:List-Bact-rpt repeat protein/hydrazine synthase alpha subunit-like protein